MGIYIALIKNDSDENKIIVFRNLLEEEQAYLAHITGRIWHQISIISNDVMASVSMIVFPTPGFLTSLSPNGYYIT